MSFFDAGGTSRQSMALLRRLRVELGRPVDLDDFAADPTIRGLRAALAGDAVRAPSLELLRAGAAGVAPVVFVHGAHGDVDLYRSVVEAMHTDAPVYGLTSSLDSAEGVGTAPIAELAERHVATLTAALPPGPVRLVGYSFGGLVAYEMARRLTARGRAVTFLGLLDVLPPTRELSRNAQRLYHLAALLARFVPGMAEDSIVDFLRTSPLGRWLPPAPPPPPDEEILRRSEALFNAHAWGPYPGPISYFRARRRIPVIMNQLYAWRRVAPHLDVVGVPGAHHDLLAAENSRALAAGLSAALRRSEV
jgi:acetoacetyl-CoA synthetase